MPRTPGTAGTCFGFDVRSAVPLALLRSGNFGATLAVDEADHTGFIQEGPYLIDRERAGRPFLRLARSGDEFVVWFDGVGWFRVDAARRKVTMPSAVDGVVREARLWGLPAMLCFTGRGDYSLHAAAVEVDGGALVLAAPGRFGKTTTASAFVASGARLLSEDLTCFAADRALAVLPGPAVLRVRHDVASQLSLPGTTVVGEDPERRFVAMDGEARGSGEPVPLRAIVFLREHAAPLRMERVEPRAALPDLWLLSFRLPDDTADQARCFTGVAALASAVPVFNVYRRLSLDDLPATVELIRRTCAEPVGV